MTVGATWARTHHFGAARLVSAASTDEVVAAVRAPDPAAADAAQQAEAGQSAASLASGASRASAASPIRALGTRHSFHDLADTAGTLITLVDAPANAVLDEAAATVTVSAGTRYGVLALWLEERGWSLHNLGSLPHISIAGAIQTGTHGSGVTNGSLTTAVRALEYVDARGEVRTCDITHDDFPALAVGLGAFGIITRVTLAIGPTYQVQQDVIEGIEWDAFLAAPNALLEAAYSVSVFTRWGEPTLQQVWIKRRLERDATTAPSPWGGTVRTTATTLVDGDPADLTEQGVAGPWLHRLPHFRLDGTPSNGDEIQTEYFVDRANSAQALQAVRDLADRIDPLLYITELRTVAADNLWLSGSYERETLAIHFTWRNDPTGVAAVLPAIEDALAPFDARAHWGKWHRFTAERLAAVHPRIADARNVFERLDPQGRFANDHLRRLGIR